MAEECVLSANESEIFTAIEKNDLGLLQTCLGTNPNVNVFDDDKMTPLQHAAYKGNKEMVQLLLDSGADANLCRHQHNYTALHFAGLSGNLDVCVALLVAGARPAAMNTVNRTAAQMAAFVGHHHCVATINNYIPKADIEYYTVKQGAQSSPYLPAFLAESFHKFVMQINLNPVRVAINLSKLTGLSQHLEEVKKTLELMSEKEMKKGAENNEVMSFKLHYLSYIAKELMRIKQDKSEFVEVFAKFLLKPSKQGSLDVMDAFLKDSIKEFPFKECTLLRQMVSTLTSPEPPSALSVITSAINGQRGFIDNIAVCQTCGEEKPTKKCAKCKMVQYCDRNCQVLHWHWHKKVCSTLQQEQHEKERGSAVNADEISRDMHNLLVEN